MFDLSILSECGPNDSSISETSFYKDMVHFSATASLTSKSNYIPIQKPYGWNKPASSVECSWKDLGSEKEVSPWLGCHETLEVGLALQLSYASV